MHAPEKLHRQEAEKNPGGTLNDSINQPVRAGTNWKATLSIIVILVIGYVIYQLLF